MSTFRSSFISSRPMYQTYRPILSVFLPVWRNKGVHYSYSFVLLRRKSNRIAQESRLVYRIITNCMYFQAFDTAIADMDRNRRRRTWRRRATTPTYDNTDEDVDMVAIETLPGVSSRDSTPSE